jgi:hydrogenase maturation protease
VLSLLAALGGEVGRVLVVGCEPARADEGIGLSEPVAAAVDHAVRVVRELADEAAHRADHSKAAPARGVRASSQLAGSEE